MASKKNLKYLGFIGFFGFMGFQYFRDYNIASLSYFAFFGFFGYFWIGKIAAEMIDEHYLENSRRAKAFGFNLAVVEFIVLYLIAPLSFVSKEFLTAITALCFASLLIAYAIAFYIYEKR
ncbi:MAG TPA: DUF3796 domain-containing protein [Hydrogenispora sp.]|nr:DUF3796 domain-containing protein [Hydrogenispora sp.]